MMRYSGFAGINKFAISVTALEGVDAWVTALYCAFDLLIAFSGGHGAAAPPNSKAETR
jgi:Na+/glutamate symporter